MVVPIAFWNSSTVYLCIFHLGGPDRPSAAPKTVGSVHTPSYESFALRVLHDGVHYESISADPVCNRHTAHLHELGHTPCDDTPERVRRILDLLRRLLLWLVLRELLLQETGVLREVLHLLYRRSWGISI
jgi:hypothetical protein